MNFPPFSYYNSRILTNRSFDVVESDNVYTITLEAPGIPPENIAVRAVEDELHVSGRSDTRTIDRVFLLPKGTLVDDIDATAANGVLTIVVPKQTARKIDVKIKH